MLLPGVCGGIIQLAGKQSAHLITLRFHSFHCEHVIKTFAPSHGHDISPWAFAQFLSLHNSLMVLASWLFLLSMYSKGSNKVYFHHEAGF